MKDWHDILQTCELQNWKEALAAVMTYARPEEFSSLCGRLQVIGAAPHIVFKSTLIHRKCCDRVFFRPSWGQTGGSRKCPAASPGLPVLHLRRKHRKTGVLLERSAGWTLSPVPSGRSTYSFQLCVLNCPSRNIYANFRSCRA